MSVSSIMMVLNLILPTTILFWFFLRFIVACLARRAPNAKVFITDTLGFPVVMALLSLVITHSLSWDGNCQSDIAERFPCSFIDHIGSIDITLVFAGVFCIVSVVAYFLITSVLYLVWARHRTMQPHHEIEV